jgi:predicted alpha/beta-fold hydrolase
MPVPSVSFYQPPWFLPGAHLQTVYPTLFRSRSPVPYQRDRLELDDGDFMDIDWWFADRPRVGILLHGLESHSRSSYMLGMARALHRAGWDVVAANFRGCSGVPNRLPRAYHSGSSDDLAALVHHVVDTYDYDDVVLIGFSLGGNVVLKYLGEHGRRLPPRVRGGAMVSVPCDLRASAYHLARPQNRLYMQRFLLRLRRRYLGKAELMPAGFDWEALKRARNFIEFDEWFTAPMHGFRSAEDYWQKSSSKAYIVGLRVPALLINARNDPFLPASCHPVGEARASTFLRLELPREGGHLGFTSLRDDGQYWHETRILNFLEENGWNAD